MNFTRRRTSIPPKQQRDVALKAHVATYISNVLEIYCKCFFRDGVKVDRDVAFVAMVCTRMLQASVFNVSSIFQTYVASVFIWMLHMFHTYVVSVLSGCCVCFAMGFKCF